MKICLAPLIIFRSWVLFSLKAPSNLRKHEPRLNGFTWNFAPIITHGCNSVTVCWVPPPRTALVLAKCLRNWNASIDCLEYLVLSAANSKFRSQGGSIVSIRLYKRHFQTERKFKRVSVVAHPVDLTWTIAGLYIKKKSFYPY